MRLLLFWRRGFTAKVITSKIASTGRRQPVPAPPHQTTFESPWPTGQNSNTSESKQLRRWFDDQARRLMHEIVVGFRRH